MEGVTQAGGAPHGPQARPHLQPWQRPTRQVPLDPVVAGVYSILPPPDACAATCIVMPGALPGQGHTEGPGMASSRERRTSRGGVVHDVGGDGTRSSLTQKGERQVGAESPRPWESPTVSDPIFTGLDIFGNIEDGELTSDLGPLRLMSVMCPSARPF